MSKFVDIDANTLTYIIFFHNYTFLKNLVYKYAKKRKKYDIFPFLIFYSSRLSSSAYFFNTSRGLEPFCGPIIPLSSSKSIQRAALLYPSLNLR